MTSKLMCSHVHTVEFRIYGETFDPDLITKRLGLSPCQVVKLGSGDNRRRPMWAYNGAENERTEWDSLEAGLKFLLLKLSPLRSQLDIYKAEGQLIWWCGHFQSSFDGGPILSPALLLTLGEFGAELYLDNYFSEEKSRPH